MENPIKMDDLGVPLFSGNIHMKKHGDESTVLYSVSFVVAK